MKFIATSPSSEFFFLHIVAKLTAISAMLSDSEMVTFLIGLDKQPFVVHKAVLDLHSKLLRNEDVKAEKSDSAAASEQQCEPCVVAVKVEQVDERGASDMEVDSVSSDETATSSYFNRSVSANPALIKQPNILPNIAPTQFGFFISWLYQGVATQDIKGTGTQQHETWEILYEIGNRLQCPGFQNYCMDELRTSEAVMCGRWPKPQEASTIYNITPHDSLLRVFAVDCLTVNHPFAPEREGSNLSCEWARLLDEITDLGRQFMKASGLSWKLVKPWDGESRKRYVIATPDLGQQWTKMFMGYGRDARVILEDAKDGCLISKLQLQCWRKGKKGRDS